jgi:mono/diheme cytochrome c family protein
MFRASRLQIVSAIALTGAALLAGSSIIGGQARDDYNSGSYLYRAFCAACHGADGTGKGPGADTLPGPVPDLTLLTRNAGGTFPRDRVLGILNGTTALPGHAKSPMPRFTDAFMTLERDQRTVEKRLAALVEHLESLQRKQPR